MLDFHFNINKPTIKYLYKKIAAGIKYIARPLAKATKKIGKAIKRDIEEHKEASYKFPMGAKKLAALLLATLASISTASCFAIALAVTILSFLTLLTGSLISGFIGLAFATILAFCGRIYWTEARIIANKFQLIKI